MGTCDRGTLAPDTGCFGLSDMGTCTFAPATGCFGLNDTGTLAPERGCFGHSGMATCAPDRANSMGTSAPDTGSTFASCFGLRGNIGSTASCAR